MNKPSSYPEVDRIIQTIKDLNLRFEKDEDEPALLKMHYRKLKMWHGENVYHIPVEDEYGDVDRMNPAVLLHLILKEVECFEEGDDFLIWCSDLGLDSTSQTCRSMYFELRDVAPQIRELIGDRAEALSDFDFEMNTGVTKALRSATFT